MTRTPLWLAAGAACAAALPFAVVRPRPVVPPPHAVFEPSPETTAVAARSLAKLYLAEEVARGRLTVPEAAAVFGWLNRQPPAIAAADIRQRFATLSAGADEVEVLCTQVTAFIVGTIRLTEPAREPDLVRMARDQLEAARGPDGRTVLPVVSEADCEVLFRRAAISATHWQGEVSRSELDGIGDGLILVGR
jgi:hypothetical protein